MATKEELKAYARAAARKYGVPEDVFVAQIQQESGFNPKASSGVAFGIAQFIPPTAKQYGVNISDPFSSLDGAARMMSDKIKQYGDVRLALAAYNGGDGGANWLKKNPQFMDKPDLSAPRNQWRNQTGEYVNKIMAAAGGANNAAPPVTLPTLLAQQPNVPAIQDGQNLLVPTTQPEADLYGKVLQSDGSAPEKAMWAKAASMIAGAQETLKNSNSIFDGVAAPPSPIDDDLMQLIESA